MNELLIETDNKAWSCVSRINVLIRYAADARLKPGDAKEMANLLDEYTKEVRSVIDLINNPKTEPEVKNLFS